MRLGMWRQHETEFIVTDWIALKGVDPIPIIITLEPDYVVEKG